jgi:hypothetical protein
MRVDWDNPISDDPLNVGLVSRWQVGEDNPLWGGPKLYDLCGINHGLLTGFAASDNPWKPAGPVGSIGSLSFSSASSQYIPTANIPNLTTWTLLAWLYDAGVGTRSVIGQIDSSAQNATFFWRYGASSGFTVGAASYLQVTLTVPPANIWTRCAFVYDGASLLGYQNGVLFDPVAASGTPANPGTTIATIGRLGDFAGQYWEGGMDDVRVYSRALSATELVAEYQDSKAGSPDTLNWYKPKRYFFVDAGGGGTFNASWARYSNILIQPGAA